MNRTKRKVVITMPAYRAEGTLAQTVADIPPGASDALILVDDASPDNTVELARELGHHRLRASENRGYGGNQKTCYTRRSRRARTSSSSSIPTTSTTRRQSRC